MLWKYLALALKEARTLFDKAILFVLNSFETSRVIDHDSKQSKVVFCIRNDSCKKERKKELARTVIKVLADSSHVT